MIQLTPFEERVMQAIGHSGGWHGAWFMSASVYWAGTELFGHGWAGQSQTTESGIQYPLINRFFGRLRSKNLVYRIDNVNAQNLGLSWGAWLLTDMGNQFLGIVS